MLRIIAGSAGGIHLSSPKGVELRPTQDRVKQSLFSSLGDRVAGAKVLDLYAGTGAVGIEALSRGADSATFVEQHRKCVACIQENLVRTHFEAKVILDDAVRYLTHLPSEPHFSLVFADPPYDKTIGSLNQHPVLQSIGKILTPGALLIFEHFFKQSFTPNPSWKLVDQRKYGETMLTLLEWNPEED